jgi:hypothetical protein
MQKCEKEHILEQICNLNSCFKTEEHDMQCTHDLTLKRFRVTTVAAEMHKV